MKTIQLKNEVARKYFTQFQQEIYFSVRNHFEKTFFVGGCVRNILLGKKFSDCDIATEATPEQMITLFSAMKRKHDIRIFHVTATNKRYGNISITDLKSSATVEITTLRKDTYKGSRYPTIAYTKSIIIDAKRRDFTVNSLYLDLDASTIYDPTNKGMNAIQHKEITFVISANKSITQDPLRMIRAIRFSVDYNLNLSENILQLFKQKKFLLHTLTQKKIQTEIKKVFTKNKNKFAKLYTKLLDDDVI